MDIYDIILSGYILLFLFPDHLAIIQLQSLARNVSLADT